MFIILIFIEILFIQIYSEDTFDCTGYEEDSVHPIYNTNDCRYYWHCIYVDTVYMKAIKRICPAGTEFDVQLNECEISSLVNCVSVKSPYTLQTSRSTRKLFSRKPWIRTTARPQQLKVLSNNSSQLTSSTFFIEQLLKKLMTIQNKSIELKLENSIRQIFKSTSIQTTTTTAAHLFVTSKLKRRHIIHRSNLTLNILTSNERKIRQFPINQTHGLFIQCNEIRRRQLRNLIFHPTLSTIRNSSSSKIFHYDILSLTIFINSFLFLQK